jgi:16S rRNA processing protein RimM
MGEWITLGRVAAVHGLDGDVTVVTEHDDPAELGRYDAVRWLGPRGDERALVIEACRVHRRAALVRFRGVADRDGAEALRGGRLQVERSALRPPPEGSHYIIDLIGLTVVTVDGRVIGPVTQVYDNGAHALYGVDHQGREVLIPAVDRFVKEIDLAGKRIVIEAVEGLLD